MYPRVVGTRLSRGTRPRTRGIERSVSAGSDLDALSLRLWSGSFVGQALDSQSARCDHMVLDFPS
jgi:hypothetical protein